MTTQKRMSPLTALFLGIFGVGAVGIAAGSGIVLYGMRVLNVNASNILGLAEDTVAGLPTFIESLPPSVGELLNDRRAPEYAAQIDVEAGFVRSGKGGTLRPVFKIINNGSETVSLLAVRVAALNEHGIPVRDWTEIVATPVPGDDAWRGPLMPHATRHVAVNRAYRVYPADEMEEYSAAVEVSDIRVWQGNTTVTKTADRAAD